MGGTTNGDPERQADKLTPSQLEFVTANHTHLLAVQSLLGPIFRSDPVMNYFCHTLPTAKRADWIPSFISRCLHSASLNSARFDSVYTASSPRDSAAVPACSAVWMPPHHEPTGTLSMIRAGIVSVAFQIGVSGLRRMFGGYVSEAEEAKRVGLVRGDGSKVTEYWYLFFVGTEERQQGQGMGAEVVRRFQREREEAKDGIPVWLEATTERSMRLYDRLGFETIRVWRLGRGEVNNEGRTEKGGEGVSVWAMVWWPGKGKGNGGEK